jgi:hypothetical protein
MAVTDSQWVGQRQPSSRSSTVAELHWALGLAGEDWAGVGQMAGSRARWGKVGQAGPTGWISAQ